MLVIQRLVASPFHLGGRVKDIDPCGQRTDLKDPHNLSARHGLLDPDTHVEPYERTMTDRDAVPAMVVADQLMSLTEAGGIDVHAFLPRLYLAKLLSAREILERGDHPVRVHDHYAGTRGIGYQRQVLAAIRSSRSTDAPHPPWRRPVTDE